MDSQFMTVNETAAFFRVTRTTIRRWCKENVFPQPIVVGKKSLFRRSDIEALANGNAVEPKS